MTFADKLNVELCNLRYSVDLHSSTITNNQKLDFMCRVTKLIFREKFCNLKNVCSNLCLRWSSNMVLNSTKLPQVENIFDSKMINRKLRLIQEADFGNVVQDLFSL